MDDNNWSAVWIAGAVCACVCLTAILGVTIATLVLVADNTSSAGSTTLNALPVFLAIMTYALGGASDGVVDDKKRNLPTGSARERLTLGDGDERASTTVGFPTGRRHQVVT
jgi:hypothetical protein